MRLSKSFKPRKLWAKADIEKKPLKISTPAPLKMYHFTVETQNIEQRSQNNTEHYTELTVEVSDELRTKLITELIVELFAGLIANLIES